MTIAELIRRLSEQPDQNEQIMILDGFNGGGYPREINFGPAFYCIDADDVKNCGDCEGLRPGEGITVMGYGCY